MLQPSSTHADSISEACKPGAASRCRMSVPTPGNGPRFSDLTG